MPEQPPGQREPRILERDESKAPIDTPVPYAELHCRSNFSFLEGASHPDELVSAAAGLGYRGFAITDRNTLAGVVRAHVAAKSANLPLIIGAEITPVDGVPIVLLATDRAAYGRLSKLITLGRRRAQKGDCELTIDDVGKHAEGLLGLVPLTQETQQRYSDTFDPLKSFETPLSDVMRYRDIFADRCYTLAELRFDGRDTERTQRSVAWCQRQEIPLAAANDVHYHTRRRRYLHDVLVATRCRLPLASLGYQTFPHAERHLRSVRDLFERLGCSEALFHRTIEISGRCGFSLDELRYEYPEELCPPEETPFSYLTRLTWDGARGRYPAGIPDKVRGLIEHELTLIEQLHYEAYFLTVHDLVRFARGRGILCQGRGSAANSVVCFCLGVTSVDPDRIDVLFERFVSAERDEAPDIDIDFEHERREEVLQYLYERYGRDRAGMTAELVTYRPRSAIRDVGRAFGLSLDRIDKLARQMEHVDREEQLAQRLEEGGLNPKSTLGRRITELVRTLLGFPRHLSQHVGGMVMSRGLLSELVPIENAAMADRTVIQWDKNDLEALGLLKVDCLALGMLSCIRRCFDLIRKHDGTDWSLATIPTEDPVVYEMICRADTVGVFQIESRAQMSMLPRLRPRCFYDLVIEVAIVRPGPIQGDMVHPYLRRRSGEEPVEYPDQRVRKVLHRTLGVPIFQEQAMRLAIVAAGFTAGEADQLRRAMGKWRKTGIIANFHQKLVDGMKANGYDEEFGERLFNQISGFGEYGFPESHAASFALLVYVSSWIKHYHPAVFCAALINSQPMGFYAPAQLVRDAVEHGVEVVPIDVNHSDWDCTLEPLTADKSPGTSVSDATSQDRQLRLGLRLVRGLSEDAAETLIVARSRCGGTFDSFEQFAASTGFTRSVLLRLSRADAFASLNLSRRDAQWQSLPARRQMPLFEGQNPTADEHAPDALPALSPSDEVVADYTATGLSVKGHPVGFLRDQLTQLGVITAEQLFASQPDRRVRVAGLVLMRQRPSTAAGITFVTLEDETGIANLVVYPGVWQKFRQVARFSGIMLAAGKLQREGDVIHVVTDRLEDVSERLAALQNRSRDFR